MVKALKVKMSILQRIKNKQSEINRINSSALGQPHKPKDKGFYLGSCNRSACLRPGAMWWNHGSHHYYCRNCAEMLNEDPVNKKYAKENFGHDLCTEGRRNVFYQERVWELLPAFKKNLEEYKKKPIDRVVPLNMWVHYVICHNVLSFEDIAPKGSVMHYRDAFENNQEVKKLYREYLNLVTKSIQAINPYFDGGS